MLLHERGRSWRLVGIVMLEVGLVGKADTDGRQKYGRTLCVCGIAILDIWSVGKGFTELHGAVTRG